MTRLTQVIQTHLTKQPNRVTLNKLEFPKDRSYYEVIIDRILEQGEIYELASTAIALLVEHPDHYNYHPKSTTIEGYDPPISISKSDPQIINKLIDQSAKDVYRFDDSIWPN